MLEFFMLRGLCTALGNSARAKGHNATGYQIMLVALWFTGEISGAIIGIVLAIIMDLDAEGPLWLIVAVFAYGLAGAGVAISFLIVKCLPDNHNPNEFAVDRDWDERDVRPRFGSRAAEPGRKDATSDPDERARREDDRYTTE